MAQDDTGGFSLTPTPDTSAPDTGGFSLAPQSAPSSLASTAPSTPIFTPRSYRGPTTPDVTTAIGTGLASGVGKSAIGAQQLLTHLLVNPALPGPQTGVNRLVSAVRNAPASEIGAVNKFEAPSQAAYPFLTGAADVGGQMSSALVPAGAIGDLAPAATWLGRAGQALRQGAISGAEEYAPESHYWKKKAEETTANIGGSMALGQIGEIPIGIGKFMDKYGPEAAKNYAVKRVIDTIKDGEESGYVKAKDIIHLHNTAHAAGVPMTLMESGGAPLQSLAGWVSRTPGAPEATIRGSFDTRMAGARKALLSMIKKNFDSPKTRRQTSKALRSAQMAASMPLYQKLFQPSSIVSIVDQFEKSFSDNTIAMKAAIKETNAAVKRFKESSKKISGDKVHEYMNSPQYQEMRDNQADAEAASKKVSNLESQKKDILSQLRAAQQSEANGIRGVVWSPHIARMIQEPVVKQGIREGMKIQKMEAATQNVPFDPNDYGVRYKTNSEDEIPEITRTPNMRLLDAGKRGLDKILNSYRDPETGKLPLNDETVRTINNLRRAWIDELDRINPHYKPARDAYAGPAALLNALYFGERIMKMNPEDVKEMFEGMSSSEQEHFRKGAAQAYSDYVKQPNFMGGELGSIAQEDELTHARERLQPIFRTKAQLDDFMDSVTGWKAIRNAKTAVIGGSPSAARLAADAAHGSEKFRDAAQIVRNLEHTNVPGILGSISRLARHFDPKQTKEVKTEIAKILADHNIKLSQIAGEVLPTPPPPPPGRFTSAARALSPIGQALGTRAGGWFENQISGQ